MNKMTFHVNHLLADDSHEMSSLIYSEKYKKMRMSSTANLLGTLRVNNPEGIKIRE